MSRRTFLEVWNSNKRAICPGGLQNILFPSQWVFTSVLCLEKHHEVTSLRLGHYIHYLLHPGSFLAAVFMIKFLYSLGLAQTEVMRPLHHSVCSKVLPPLMLSHLGSFPSHSSLLNILLSLSSTFASLRISVLDSVPFSFCLVLKTHTEILF